MGLYNHLTDPENSGEPSFGVDAVVVEGAIRKSTFVQSALFVRPLPWMMLNAGNLVAESYLARVQYI